MKNENLSQRIAPHIERDDWAGMERYFNESEFSKHLGIAVSLADPAQPKCEISEIQAFHLGGIGQNFVNGAIISAVFDLGIGLTGLRYASLVKFATTNVNIHLLKPVQNNRFYLISKCNKKIGRRLFSEATLFNFRDEPCAYATGEIRINIEGKFK